MPAAPDLPMALWKANLDLQLRIGRLLQDSTRDWMDLGTRAAGEGATEIEAEARRLLHGGNWQALAALPVEAFWRQAEQRVGDGQALNQLVLRAQEDFVRGLAEALGDWQSQLAAAWSGGALATGLPDPGAAWNDLLRGWQAALADLVPGAAGARPRASTQARGGREHAGHDAPARTAAASPPPTRPAAAARTSAARKAATPRKRAPGKGSRGRGG